MSSVLKQGGLCLEARGTDVLGLAECKGNGANRPQSQVRTLPPGGDSHSYTTLNYCVDFFFLFFLNFSIELFSPIQSKNIVICENIK